VEDIERDAADLVAVIVGDEYGKMPIAQVRMLVEQSPRQRIGGIHRYDVVRQFSAALIGDSSGIDQIEVIEWHQRLLDMLLRSMASRHLRCGGIAQRRNDPEQTPSGANCSER
jgi:hypothetical protein